MSPLWSDMAIAHAIKSAARAQQDGGRSEDGNRKLERVGNGWAARPREETARRPIRRRLASCAL